MKGGKRKQSFSDWQPRADWTRIETIDAHAAGEPLRVFLPDLPALAEGTILDRRAWMMEHRDALRTALMWEPRGHREMYGCIVMPPERPDSDVGVLFLHNEGFSTMCGHGIIAVTTVLLETGFLAAIGPVTAVRIDTPAGLVVAEAAIEHGRVVRVSFVNVPSFVYQKDLRVKVPEIGEVVCDVAFGGAFYAYVEASQAGLSCLPSEYGPIVRAGMAIKRAVSESITLSHPDDARLGYLYGTIFVAGPRTPGVHSRNVCVFADGQVDRSPTGTGVGGRLAIHHSRGELGTGDPIRIESIIGTTFDCGVVGTARVGSFEAIIPRVSGEAHITGRHTFFIDPADPLKDGFIL